MTKFALRHISNEDE